MPVGIGVDVKVLTPGITGQLLLIVDAFALLKCKIFLSKFVGSEISWGRPGLVKSSSTFVPSGVVLPSDLHSVHQNHL